LSGGQNFQNQAMNIISLLLSLIGVKIETPDFFDKNI